MGEYNHANGGLSEISLSLSFKEGTVGEIPSPALVGVLNLDLDALIFNVLGPRRVTLHASSGLVCNVHIG